MELVRKVRLLLGADIITENPKGITELISYRYPFLTEILINFAARMEKLNVDTEKFHIEKWVSKWLLDNGVHPNIVFQVKMAIFLISLFILCVLALWIARKLLLRAVTMIVQRTKATWDDVLLEKKVFNSLAHIAPALVIQYLAPYMLTEFGSLAPVIIKITNAYIVAVVMMVIVRFLNAINTILKESPLLRDKPLDSYFQLARIITYLIGGVLIFSFLFDKSPLYFLSAFGAMTAIILLIFKDTILGFVASIQLSANNMVNVGDWVEMPKYGADGDITQITLTTVKVQNFDKTITTIPTYAFISDSFKNWRGMTESGVRRIKRPINIKIGSLKFCDDEMLERFSKFQLLKAYLEEKRKEIEEYNRERNIDASEVINGRQLTNVGVFRIYAESYLKNNPNLNKDMSCMVRQLPPTETGIPMEVYAFTNTTVWVQYERIQSDIFDHLLTAASKFDLEIFENPTGADFKKLVKH